MKRALHIIVLVLFFGSVHAQQTKVRASVDTTRNKIGAQFDLSLRTTVEPKSAVVFPSGANFGQLEVIRDYVADTISNNGKLELIKRYGLTQFDSGRYTIPPLRVLIDNKPYFTDSINIEVVDVAVDTLKQKMFDIKPILEAEQDRLPIVIKWILIVLAIVGIGFLAYRLIRKYLRRSEIKVEKSPIERATQLLQILEKKELLQKGEIKPYYSELTDIARSYIEEAIHIPAMESTTSELIAALRSVSVAKKIAVPAEVLQNLENVLRQADLVKFAKSRPLDYEIKSDRQKIEKAILLLDKSVPELTEDEVQQRETLRLETLKKRRRNKIVILVSTAFLLLIGTAVYFIATKGFDFVKDNVVGHPTKELIEGEWVSSEYGNPAIAIETPAVLKRMDPEKFLPKGTMALLKEFQSFAYGSMLGNFYVVVSTNTYKGQAQIDLRKGIDGMINVMELQGARNILVKQDEYKTANGISGMKAYGSFTIVDPETKDKRNLHYEALLFKQQNGLQQIMIIHEDGDKYAEAITQRILNSVELQTANAP